MSGLDLLPHPFDLSIVPENLEVDDALPQSVVQDAVLCTQLGDVDESARFYAQTPTRRSLSYLRRVYETRDKAKASSLLSNRHRIQYDHPDYVTPPDSLNVSWSIDRHYVDMLVCVGRRIGLGAIIPNQVMNSLYSIQVDFRNRLKEFKAKHNRLGFNPTGCMLWIGKMPSADDVWIAWVQENSEEEDNIASSTTCLSERHHRIVIMFFAFVLNKCGHRDIAVHEKYPDITKHSAVNEATNFLQRSHSINLTLDGLKTLDIGIRRWYAQWIQEAPQTYKSDNFFLDRSPIAVTSIYGQNQPLAMWDDETDEDTDNWSRSRDFTKLKYVSVSIASHFEVEEVTCWQNRDLNDIRIDHGDVFYDSLDPDTREQILLDQLDDLPMLDEAGGPIHIYTEDGFRIQRRLAGHNPDIHPHGVLLDLRDVGVLFKSEDSATPFTVYPQAGLVTAGHIQAEGLVAPYLPLLQQLNSKVRVPLEDDYMDGDDTEIATDAPIIGISCQAYNAVMHNTRGRCAQHHDAQRGLVTAALAGGFARTNANTRTARILQSQCKNRLPHLEFKQKIANNNDQPLDCSLRFENTFVVNMDRLNPLYHDGGKFMKDIILPLGMYWSHPNVLDAVKHHAVLFKPDIYPQIYNWVTFPLVSLIETIYSQCTVDMDATPPSFPDPCLVELCSVAERALNYMHTGNAAVISTTVMNPLWVGNAVVHDGLPCLNRNIISLHANSQVSVMKERWPYHQARMQPKTSSSAAQIFAYDLGHFNGFFAYLCLHLASFHPVPALASDKIPSFAGAKGLAFFALKLLVQDIKNIVAKHVWQKIKEGLADADHNIHRHASERKKI
ncbi:hypothetical protein F5887DRAFT_1084263 [Amanita rubescens]|nr:hypothetical protein F5887DRAFT_1084263 [Amanita rubescens]